MDITTVRFDKPDDLSVFVGQSHFVKSDEDEAERKELLRRFGYKL